MTNVYGYIYTVTNTGKTTFAANYFVSNQNMQKQVHDVAFFLMRLLAGQTVTNSCEEPPL
jgi:hypothetical protein